MIYYDYNVDYDVVAMIYIISIEEEFNMAIISIRCSDSQEKVLQERAQRNNQTVSEYIFGELFPCVTVSESYLTHAEILKKVDLLQQGELFSIPSLFTSEQWDSFENTVSIGRTFRIAEKKSGNIISDKVKFIEKKSGMAGGYQKK